MLKFHTTSHKKVRKELQKNEKKKVQKNSKRDKAWSEERIAVRNIKLKKG